MVLGSVVLCITGGEALYADLGHFGRRPIQYSWCAIVFPCLLLNYFGQGAGLLRDPTIAPNPFYSLVPSSLIYPMAALSTMATVIASQALISGVFSLTRQAIQLGVRAGTMVSSLYLEGDSTPPLTERIRARCRQAGFDAPLSPEAAPCSCVPCRR